MENISLEDLISLSEDRLEGLPPSPPEREAEADPNPKSEEPTTKDNTSTEEVEGDEGTEDIEDIEDTEGTKTAKDTEGVESNEEGKEGEEGNTEVNALEEYYSILQENQLLYTDEDFEFDGTPEALEKAILQTKANLPETVAKSLWEKLPEDFKPLLEYGLKGGKDINKFLNTFSHRKLEDLDPEGSVDDQKEILYQYFKNTTKYSDDKINRLVSRLDAAGELEEEALTAMSELKEIQDEERKALVKEAELRKAQEEKEAWEQRQNMSSFIDEAEFIPKSRKSKVKSFIFNLKKSGKGDEAETDFNRVLKEISSNQEHLIQLADLLMEYNPKKGLNLDRIKKQQSTKVAQNIKNKLEAISSNSKSKVTGKTSKITESNFDWDEFFRQN